ncbi:MAG: TIM barrel protein [Acidimicrobiia bacterium]|nr:TIM barrel protein [Acidimicrobiia bacterium]
MIRSLCLEMIYGELPFCERIRAAAAAGYEAIEFWDWRNKDLAEVAAVTRGVGLPVAAFSGNRRHTMANPADLAGFREEIRESLEAARKVGARCLMLLTDRLLEDGSAAALPENLSASDKMEAAAVSLGEAASLARGSGVTMALEPLNTRLDHPRYFLDNSAAGFDLVRKVNVPEARLLYDAYHMAMMGEDVTSVVSGNLELIGHIHAADMPGRHEPGSGEIDYAGFAAALKRLNYTGAVGMEFSPSGGSAEAAEAARRIFS